MTTLAVCVLGAVVMSPPAVADTVRSHEWILPVLSVAQAQHFATGKGVTVGVIDTGVSADQPDLRGNILPGVDLTSGLPKATGDVDTDGHGTSIAGLIAGHGHGRQNRDGILGIAPLAKVLPIRVSRDSTGDFGSAGQAVTWAVNHGANVICMAFGSNSQDELTAGAMLAAFKANVVLVAAAGNVTQGSRIVEYPAAYPGVVAVAGTDEHGNHSKVSVTGNLITIAAPSDNIPSTYNNGGYAIGSGTSSSTAIVAGAAALVRSRFSNLTAGEIVNRLTATAIDKGPPGRDDEYGYGLLNLVGALTAKVPPAGSTTASPSASASPATTTPEAATPNQTGSLAPETRSMSTTIISVVAVIVVLLAFLTAWILVRRRRPG